ncbi:MAG: lycopene cyclase domain-containing protein [Candidatus Omnitrophica bacterium]|nr:lycopene cyclase domain-containing protein [Candidatus Omnitrophota bacterium]
MKEYTFLAAASVILTIFIDCKSSKLYRRGEYYIFLAVILFFKLLVNGYLTGNNIVIYNTRFFLGFRLGSIPLEDFLFGYSMVTLTLVFWEYFKKKFALSRDNIGQ